MTLTDVIFLAWTPPRSHGHHSAGELGCVLAFVAIAVVFRLVVEGITQFADDLPPRPPLPPPPPPQPTRTNTLPGPEVTADEVRATVWPHDRRLLGVMVGISAIGTALCVTAGWQAAVTSALATAVLASVWWWCGPVRVVVGIHELRIGRRRVPWTAVTFVHIAGERLWIRGSGVDVLAGGIASPASLRAIDEACTVAMRRARSLGEVDAAALDAVRRLQDR